MTSFALSLLIGYLLGSIPTSIWISKLVYHRDIRQFGSGNAGATNVYRVLGWKPAIVVVLVDVAKGAIPTWWATRLFDVTPELVPWLQIVAGAGAIAGHCWTLFAGFKGGKGVATGAGMLIVLYPIAVPICIVVFALTVYTTRYVSLASILAATTLPLVQLITVWGFGKPMNTPLLLIGFSLLPFVLFTHRANVGRLLRGEENKISSKPTHT